jgi:hypothetical protein
LAGDRLDARLHAQVVNGAHELVEEEKEDYSFEYHTNILGFCHGQCASQIAILLILENGKMANKILAFA